MDRKKQQRAPKCVIPFNNPVPVRREKEYISQAVGSGYLSGDGLFTKKCHEWIEQKIWRSIGVVDNKRNNRVEYGYGIMRYTLGR